MAENVKGILLLYHHLLTPNAATIMDHVDAFRRYSRFPVWSLNTELGFPARLPEFHFETILLHYSLFGTVPYRLNEQFIKYLEQSGSSYKVAFFQDEYHHCKQRFEFLDHHRVDCVYTLVEPQQYKDTYQKYTRVPKLVNYIPGYVSENMVELAGKFYRPDAKRRIDVGYRGRQLPFYMGRGSQEKTDIAIRFKEKAGNQGLRLDIETGEQKRLYGKNWYRFLANCRAVLGVEAGVSVYDIEDRIRPEYDRLASQNPEVSFKEVFEQILSPYEENIYYRTISPRHFEAAAFRNCQVLYEGRYSGILEPMVHYIPLKKDLSNFDEVIRLLRDASVRQELTENAYQQLIATDRYTFRQHVQDFDQELLKAGLGSELGGRPAQQVTTALQEDHARRVSAAYFETARIYPFPGRQLVRHILMPFLSIFRKLKHK